MGYSVKERAEYVGTFRWVEVRLMEMLASWVPTTPEMEVKVLFGRHVWDCAQHADQLGKRAFELRAPLHYTLPALPDFRAFLADVAALGSTAERVGVYHGVVCAAMTRQYRSYIETTDSLMDEPTVRILENALRDYERMSAERERLAGALPAAARLAEWRARSEALVHIVAHGEADRRARGTTA